MATPNFNYDIFISYRHNDNKAPGGSEDGWVTEFVNNLTTELDTMVKGGASIYFDKDPDTGLRETDLVEESLSPRLQSLIFIPILSQTYCDPQSYAWKQEFLPFLRHSAQDSTGLTVKLHNGNFASRVLPVCIHDLDSADANLVEKQMEGKLRTIPFIFKSPGVNRPLRGHEDDPMKNVNRTLYRDQINKLAIAIKEIINTVRGREGQVTKSKEVPKKNPLLEGLLKSASTVQSIAVLPLVFRSQDPGEEFLSQGFAEDLFGSLKQIRALRLSIHGLTAPMNGTHNGDAQTSPVQATMILSGSMTVQHDSIGVNVCLVESKDETIVWQSDFSCPRDELFTFCLLYTSPSPRD